MEIVTDGATNAGAVPVTVPVVQLEVNPDNVNPLKVPLSVFVTSSCALFTVELFAPTNP